MPGMTGFEATRPGAWLRDDIADILTALMQQPRHPEYASALLDTATALGLRWRATPADTAIDTQAVGSLRSGGWIEMDRDVS